MLSQVICFREENAPYSACLVVVGVRPGPRLRLDKLTQNKSQAARLCTTRATTNTGTQPHYLLLQHWRSASAQPLVHTPST